MKNSDICISILYCLQVITKPVHTTCLSPRRGEVSRSGGEGLASPQPRSGVSGERCHEVTERGCRSYCSVRPTLPALPRMPFPGLLTRRPANGAAAVLPGPLHPPPAAWARQPSQAHSRQLSPLAALRGEPRADVRVWHKAPANPYIGAHPPRALREAPLRYPYALYNISNSGAGLPAPL